MLSLSVRNFGPIREANVEVRPLTVLIGANNTGKSYLAILTYALHNPLGRFPFRMEPSYLLFQPAFMRARGRLSDETKAWIRSLPRRGKVSFQSLPPFVAADFENVLSRFVKSLGSPLTQEIQRCFASELVHRTVSSLY